MICFFFTPSRPRVFLVSWPPTSSRPVSQPRHTYTLARMPPTLSPAPSPRPAPPPTSANSHTCWTTSRLFWTPACVSFAPLARSVFYVCPTRHTTGRRGDRRIRCVRPARNGGDEEASPRSQGACDGSRRDKHQVRLRPPNVNFISIGVFLTTSAVLLIELSLPSSVHINCYVYSH